MKRCKRYFGSVKEYEVEMFGETYDLSKCTPEERAEAAAWYEKNKHENVPFAGDKANDQVRMEGRAAIDQKPSDDLSFELALESLRGNTTFNPILKGREQPIALYKLVHPLGGNLSLTDAAKQLGINRVTGFRWLKRLQVCNPTVYDLDKWPTKAQLDVYRLIHPDLGGLTYREAAKALNDTYQHVVSMIARMRKTHPQAFVFEHLDKPTISRYDPSVHDEQATEKF